MSETGTTNIYRGPKRFVPKQLENTQGYFLRQSPGMYDC